MCSSLSEDRAFRGLDQELRLTPHPPLILTRRLEHSPELRALPRAHPVNGRQSDWTDILAWRRRLGEAQLPRPAGLRKLSHRQPRQLGWPGDLSVLQKPGNG